MQREGIGLWIERKRARCGDDIALAYRDQRISYRELADRIRHLSAALSQYGVTRGDRVAYLGNNHPSFLEVLFATARLGAIFVPLNTRLAAPELEYMLENSGAKMLIFHEELAELARAASWSAPVEHRIAVDGESRPRVTAYTELFAAGDPQGVTAEVHLDDPAIILYTSGTTGHPKGAVITHGNLTWNSFNALVDYGVSPRERVLLISPMFHVASLANGALLALLQGGTVVLHEKFEPGDVLRTIEDEGITMLAGVPTTFQMLQEHPNWESADLSSLQRLTCGGSAVPERIMKAYDARGLGFSVGYGMTETSPGATALPAHRAIQKVGSSGLPHFFTDVKIVNESGETLPPYEVGEIWVRGRNVISEYWQNPAATAASFVDGWFKSGDLGYFDEEGYIYISDRLKDMIISGGENIYSAEVESIIMEIPQVTGVALVGVPDDTWGEVPHAYVTAVPGSEVSDEVILTHLQGRLAKYKIPKEVHFVDEFPRTASGKIRKNELRATTRAHESARSTLR